MAKNDAATAAAATAVSPPAVRRGRKPAEVDAELVAGMKGLLENDEWAGDGIAYSDKATANKAISNYKRALVDAGVEGTLTSRTWEDDGAIRIAIGRKSD